MYTVLHQRDFPEPLGSQLDDFYSQIKLEEFKERFSRSSVDQRARVRMFIETNKQKLSESIAGRELIEFIQSREF